mgnify:FL=1
MALKYVVKKTVFGFDKTKTTKYVVRPLPAGTVNYSALCDQVTKLGIVVPRSVVRMVIDSLVEVLEYNLANHMSVKLGDFGTLRLGFSCKSQDSEGAVNEESLCQGKTIFPPGASFKNMLRDVSIRKFEISKNNETGLGSGSSGSRPGNEGISLE